MADVAYRLGRRFARSGGPRSVRVRITAAATVVAALAIAAAGLWLVRAVEGSLSNDLRSAEAADIQKVSASLLDGSSPSDADLARLGAVGGSQAVQVIADDGHVVASSPNVEGMPPLDSIMVVRSDGAGPGVMGRTAAGAAVPTRQVYELPQGAIAVTQASVAAPAGTFTVLAASPLAGIRRSVDAVENGLLVALPVLVVVVGVLVWVLTGRALRPVEAIRAEVESISGSTLSRRVPVPGSSDEVARLARTMNAMLDRLEAAAARQQQFVADASHELRSPVAAIRTELEVARHLSGTDWHAVADQVLVEEARLEATISDLLLSASLDEGAPLPDVGPVDMSDLARSVVERTAGRSGVSVSCDAAGSHVIEGSRLQLERAVGNLVENAVRHARSSVVVGVAADAVGVTLTVDDDGVGIPEDERERIFERFTRLDEHRARAASDGGAGLGLALVRQIVGRHGGEVRAAESPTGGARLVVTVPVRDRTSP